MNIPVVPTVLIAGGITGAGHMALGKKVPIGVYVGVPLLSLALAFLDNVSPELASGFALLVLVGAIWLYIPVIAKNLRKAGVR